MSRRWKLCLCALCLLPTLACGLPSGGGEDDQEPDQQTGPSPRELEGAKMNVYVGDCYNAVDARVLRSVHSYEQFLTWSDNLQNVRNPPSGLDPRIQAATCREAATRAAAMPPSLPELEQAANAYAAAIEGLLPVFAEAQLYYARGSFRDDAMARGRELHPRLLAAITAFRAARGAFSEAMSAVETRRTDERLAELAADPLRHGELLIERLQRHGRQLLEQNHAMIAALAEQGRIPDALRQGYLTDAARLEAEVNELQSYQAVPGERLPGGFSNYRAQAENLLRGQTRVMRYVRDHQHHEVERLQSHVEHAVNGFNSLVSAYNDLRFRD